MIALALTVALELTVGSPTIPPPLALPQTGASLLLHAIGRGVQIYTCSASTIGGNTSYAFALTAPDATLYDEQMHAIGKHSAGPTWTLTDGSNVVGALQAKSPSPTPAAVPWLLLKVASNNGAGRLARATFVHRLNTSGGLAPASGCDAGTVGKQARVDYTADYYFWGK